tara:strand:+ start:1508 stop:2218 length:711 start_codon:yes stop_codon:yes gene_type:complete
MDYSIAISLLSLTVLEIVLGVDNLVILSILVNRAPPEWQLRTMRIGLTLAWVMRLVFLAFAVWLSQLTQPLFYFVKVGFSVRDIFMLVGGVFLLIKATHEIHQNFEETVQPKLNTKVQAISWILAQIVLLDLIFSIDSILTAIGLTHLYWVMATAITIAILVMLFASRPVHYFIQQHPTIKMLALSFLLLIGTVLIAEGLHFHIERGYLYFAICFSLFVEFMNIRLSNKKKNKESS